MTSLAKIPFHGGAIVAAKDSDGKPVVALKPVCDSLEIDVESQRKRLKRQPWARTVIMTVPSAGGNQDTTMMDRQTFTMWLATIETSRIKNEDAKQLLIAYQKEAAQALDQYFNEGVAVNPRATDEQLISLANLSKAQLSALAETKGFVPDSYIEARMILVTSRMLGEAPEFTAESTPLYVDEYLEGRGVEEDELKSIRSMFGRYVSAKYQELYGEKPMKVQAEMGGRFRKRNAYTEADRPLFDQVWQEHYARPQLALAG